MSEIKKLLASSLGQRDEQPNIELAKSIAKAENTVAVKELIGLLDDKNKNLQSDVIKVLYEVAETKPELVAPYFDQLLALFSSKNPRMIWGAMTAIDAITEHIPEKVFEKLPEILAGADLGAVIARDHAVGILVKLASVKEYVTESKTLLLEQLKVSPVNQLPMYAEMILPVANASSKNSFIPVLTSRLVDIDKESKLKRVEKVIKKLKAIK